MTTIRFVIISLEHEIISGTYCALAEHWWIEWMYNCHALLVTFSGVYFVLQSLPFIEILENIYLKLGGLR